MSHLTVKRSTGTIHVPLATVQDVIDLMDANYARRRIELVSDMEAMNASESAKLEAMKELRDRRGMTSDLIREAFTLPGARSIIEHVADPGDHEALLEESPDEIVQIALKILGFEVDDTEAEEGSADADPPKGGVTSIRTQ
jgi:hypothetical protein